ncbi:threonyl-tRNA synthetase ThrS [Thermacetogenium phaeum DSM 12270]|uniref:Threonine--tRNA ligase n=2 Tax=Thermacetogenium phaeum TaxID=85874 RepID=K4LED0_THEPS|nr:threonyl-tRNA synthetase ThrS [Thermacetogenium phaeum DSM 12270]
MEQKEAQRMITVILKDGSSCEVPWGSTWGDVAAGLSRRLAREAVAARVDGDLQDLSCLAESGKRVEFLTFAEEEGRAVYRHTSSHVLAQAVKRLFPDAKLAIGPAIEDGFYYDFDTDHPFTTEDLGRIEEEMKRIIKENYPVIREEVSHEEAIALFEERNEPYKVELIKELPPDVQVTVYRQGEFCDLCLGPHLPSTGSIGAVKLLSVAGAYWKGSEKNKMLQRIYGTSFPKKKDLDEYLQRIEEAKRRDHRRLGQELDLFGIADEGPGFPFFYPKGMIIRTELENYWRSEHRKRGYLEIKSPIILNRALWERSGHWEHYQENMYFLQIDGQDYAVKPMNCPGAMIYYKTRLHSYRELPLRIGELGLVHRHERSGVLHGLMRVRCFTQDDAHIFMLPEQITDEIINVMDMIDDFYRTFGFSYRVELSTKPENAMGSDEIWETATRALVAALEQKGLPYRVNEGDGAFYGPKIDFHLTDSLGRSWQCGTIQLDFVNPENFDLTYIAEDGSKKRPVMIHRVIFGSIERFLGILTEHYAGAFPVWLAPVQVKVLTVASRHTHYASEVAGYLEREGIRVEQDDRNERVGYKIREGELEKVPYLLVVGDQEVESRTVRVRRRGYGDQGAARLEDFASMIKDEIARKAR